MEERIAAPCILIVIVLLLGTESAPVPGSDAEPHCQIISVALCKDLPYNQTSFPNLVGNEDQREADLQLSTFAPLIQVQCSSLLKFFLCSVYVPMCTPKTPVTIGPCRPLCESVRKGCEPMLSQFGYPWPTSLNCTKFPLQNNERAMCMKGPTEASGNHWASSSSPQRPDYPVGETASQNNCGRDRSPDLYVFVNRTGTCSLKCGMDSLFTGNEKQTAEKLAFSLASFCFISALLCCLTQLASRGLHYPELPLFYITLCYGGSGTVYLIRWLAGRDAVSCVEYAGTNILVIAGGLQQIFCSIVGILLYFFQTAAGLWWVLLCWLWFLSVVLRWSKEALALHNFLFHLGIWATSCFLVVMSLVKQGIESDELLGLCFIGQTSSSRPNLLIFLIIPEVVVLLIGAASLILSVCALFLFDNGANKAEPLSRWTGILAASYLPVSCILLACYWHEYRNSPDWSIRNRPNVEVFFLKLSAHFLYGLFVGVGVISSKLFAVCSERLVNSTTPTSSKQYPHRPLTPKPSFGQPTPVSFHWDRRQKNSPTGFL